MTRSPFKTSDFTDCARMGLIQHDTDTFAKTVASTHHVVIGGVAGLMCGTAPRVSAAAVRLSAQEAFRSISASVTFTPFVKAKPMPSDETVRRGLTLAMEGVVIALLVFSAGVEIETSRLDEIRQGLTCVPAT
jgi:hypothetical protein